MAGQANQGMNGREGVIIGIDAGTSVVKSVAFTLDGRQIAEAARPNRYWRVADGGVEQDMGKTWKDTAATLREVVEKLPGGAASVISVSVTGQGDGTWLVDRDGEPVAPAWLWLDARSGALATELIASPSYPRRYETTGSGLNACQQGVHLLHMKRHMPELLERSATALHCKDWLYFRLTGQRATDPTEACFTFGDYRTRNYSDFVIEELGLRDERRLLPPIVDGRTESHALSDAAARATGLTPGTPVVLGYVDVVCTGIGGGLIDPTGEAGCSILGSTGMHMRYVKSAKDVVLNESRSGYVMLLPDGQSAAQIQSNMAATLNIDWMLDLACGILRYEGVERGRKDLVRQLDERVLDARPVSALYHPYISEAGERGPFMDPFARAQFTGLQSDSGFYDLMRAVLEGLGFASRDCYEATGMVPREVRLTGGAARSKAMRLILASVLGRPIRTVEREEAGAAGAAMIAAVQAGLYPNIQAAAEAWVEPLVGPASEPDAALVPTYDEAFALYRELREKLQPCWARLAEIKSRHET
ncbi:FGGY-family carbohydrate kinase [Aureimonas psammosilenae]|uniref:FGGY-family carbohydrate kinase n=1 Tax=Aureimonas psammosilenae TaxID=2495496 RepID=UPI001F43A46A|nr:FGGY-family carbohydrate kinase [Aureimonas psammosilenae]